MKQHTIAVSDFDGYSFKHQIASSVGRGESKSLEVVTQSADLTTARYEVCSKGELLLPTKSLQEAVAAYNEA